MGRCCICTRRMDEGAAFGVYLESHAASTPPLAAQAGTFPSLFPSLYGFPLVNPGFGRPRKEAG